MLPAASLLLPLLLLLGQRSTSAAGRCQFPSELRGRWYQSGLGQVNIRRNSIGGKGVCRDAKRDLFLLENRDDGCFRCLLMMSRHRNIIQYKESFCVQEGTLHKVCAEIRVEATLYTLVREQSSPTRCPLSVAYYFNYDDGVSGSCDTDRSYVKPCVGHRRLEMHFEHCSASAQLNGQDAQLECLATWKDGSDTYMYGRFTGRRLLNKEETYRCFQYELYGSEVYMAMSADASCRGLRSSRAGPLILQLRQDVNGWPKPSCRFPEWLVSFSWRDLAGKQLFNSSGSSQTFVGFNRRKSGAKLRRRSEYRCIETLRHVTEDGLYTVLAFSTHECMSKYQCLQFRRLADGALKFKQGKLMDMDRATRCLNEDQYESVHILTDDKLKSGHCPRSGIYTATSPTSCFSYADVGCHQRDVIVVHSTCPETPSLTLQCSSSHWRHNNDTYVIVTKRGSNSTATSCIRVRRRGEETELSTDSLCSGGVSHAQHSDAVKTLLRGTRERCPGSHFDTSDDTTVGKESDSRKSNSDDVGVDVGDNGISSDKVRTKEVRTASPSGDHIIKHRPDETVDSTAGGAHDRNYFDNGYENADDDANSNRRTSIVIDVTSGAVARAPIALGPVMVVVMWLCRVLAN